MSASFNVRFKYRRWSQAFPHVVILCFNNQDFVADRDR